MCLQVRQVRLYQGSQRRNIMWVAVQQAFTFFWTLQEGMSEPLPQGFTAADLAALRQQVTSSSSPSGSPTAYQVQQLLLMPAVCSACAAPSVCRAAGCEIHLLPACSSLAAWQAILQRKGRIDAARKAASAATTAACLADIYIY